MRWGRPRVGRGRAPLPPGVPDGGGEDAGHIEVALDVLPSTSLIASQGVGRFYAGSSRGPDAIVAWPWAPHSSVTPEATAFAWIKSWRICRLTASPYGSIARRSVWETPSRRQFRRRLVSRQLATRGHGGVSTGLRRGATLLGRGKHEALVRGSGGGVRRVVDQARCSQAGYAKPEVTAVALSPNALSRSSPPQPSSLPSHTTSCPWRLVRKARPSFHAFPKQKARAAARALDPASSLQPPASSLQPATCS